MRLNAPSLAAVLVAACALATVTPARAATAADTVLAELRDEAAAARPLARTELGRGFLDAVAMLPPPEARTLWTDSARTGWWTDAEAAQRPDSVRAKLVKRSLAAGFFYTTRYGTPLAYLRPLEWLGERGVADLRGARVLDYGCGNVAQLRLLALGGAQVTGVDVDPVLRALYGNPGDLGPVPGGGSVALVTGKFPGDPAVAAAVGGGYRLFVSKNTLKKGYVHPDTTTDPRQRVDLGADDATFLRAVHDRLEPGGWFLVYNLGYGPKRKEGRYDPTADAGSPWTREQFERAGFEVLALDAPDDEPARAMAKAFGWDAGEGGMKLDQLAALVTLARRPAAKR
jgi:SAM-dependent methyltransferase